VPALRRALICSLAPLALVGCGGASGPTGSTGSSAASRSTAASKSAQAILAEVAAEMKKVRSYHVDGVDVSTDGRTRVVGDVSASGAVKFRLQAGGQTAEFVSVRRRTYLKADRAFWLAQVGPSGAKVAKLLADRWVKVPAAEAAVLTKALEQVMPETVAYCATHGTGTLTIAGRRRFAGKDVVVIADKGDVPGGAPGELYVAATGRRLPLRQRQTGPSTPGKSTEPRCHEPSSTTTSADGRFSRFDKPVRIAEPRGALDLTKLSAGASASKS
jgi:hypothetical protein